MINNAIYTKANAPKLYVLSLKILPENEKHFISVKNSSDRYLP